MTERFAVASIGRRGLLLGMAGAAGAGVLAGCRTEGGRPTAPQQSADTEALLPTFQQIAQQSPDLDAGDQEIPVAFFAYPADRFTSTIDKPLAGDTITSAAESIGPIPPPADRNAYWRGLNERLGGELEMIITPGADYIQKLQALVAGDTIPDVVQIKPMMPNLPSLLQAKFTDLGEYLSGDAVLDFPNLAAIPSYAWEACIYGGVLYGVPFAQPLLSNGLAMRSDIVKELGLSTTLDDGQQFLDWCAELTDTKGGRWALSRPERILQYVVAPMVGSPNTWRIDGDTFVSEYETEEFAEALTIVRQMWADELFHPDSLTNLPPDLFTSGKVVTDQNGLTAWSGGSARSSDQDYELEMVVLPKWDGGGVCPMNQLNGIYTYASIRQNEPEQVRKILAMMNWLAAPVGSEEHLYSSYGEEGVHFSFNDDGDPVPQGNVDETKLPRTYLGRGAPYIYSAGDPGYAQTQFDYHQAVKPTSNPYPARGLFSPTDLNKGGQLRAQLFDELNAVIAGRKTVDDWSRAVEDWKSQGGATIAQEYQESRQQNA